VTSAPGGGHLDPSSAWPPARSGGGTENNPRLGAGRVHRYRPARGHRRAAPPVGPGAPRRS